MFEITLCNYPALLVEIVTFKHFIIPIVMLIFFFVVGCNLVHPKGVFEVIGNLIFSLLLTIMILNVMTAASFFKGETTPNQINAFNKYLTDLNKTNFTESEKSQLKEFAQCSIQDGKISGFEYQQFEIKYLKFKTIQDTKMAIEKSQATIDAK